MLTGLPFVGWDRKLAAQVRRRLQERQRADWFDVVWGSYSDEVRARARAIGELAKLHLGWSSPCVHPDDDLRALFLEPGSGLRFASFLMALTDRLKIKVPDDLSNMRCRQLVALDQPTPQPPPPSK